MRNALGAVFLTVFALIWTCGVGAFDCALVWSVYKQQQATVWPAASATVTRSEIVKSRGSKGGTTYRPVIEYDYVVPGEDHAYHSNRHAFGMFDSSSSHQLAMDAIARFPVGAAVQARFNPANHAEATLTTGINPETLFAVLFFTPFNCVLLGLWGAGIAWTWRAIAKPACGGLKLLDADGMTLIRVAWVSPSMAGLLCTGLLGFASVFIVGVFMKSSFSLATAGVALGVIYGLGVGAGVFVYLFGARWHRFIIIDANTATITIPPLGSRKTPDTFPLASITDVRSRTVRRGKSSTQHLCIDRITDHEDEPNMEWAISLATDRLDGLVAYLRERAALMKAI